MGPKVNFILFSVSESMQISEVIYKKSNQTGSCKIINSLSSFKLAVLSVNDVTNKQNYVIFYLLYKLTFVM